MTYRFKCLGIFALLCIPQIQLLLFLIRKSQRFFPCRVIVNRHTQCRQICFLGQLIFHQNLCHIRRGILRIHIQHFVNIFACLLKILIFQIQVHALHQIVRFAALLHFLHNGFLHHRGRRFALPAQLLHAAYKILHPAQLRHVLRLQASKFLGHVIRIQPLDTTFSTFMNEGAGLMKEENYLYMILYLFGSLALGLVAVLAGHYLAKIIA